MTAVVIGIDPQKRSNTALVLDARENVLAKKQLITAHHHPGRSRDLKQPVSSRACWPPRTLTDDSHVEERLR